MFWGIKTVMPVYGLYGLMIKIVVSVVAAVPYLYIVVMNQFEKDLVLGFWFKNRSRRCR